MRRLKQSFVVVGLFVAYLVLFLGGAAALGPAAEAPISEAQEGTALWMAAAVAAVDMLIFHAWLTRARDRGILLWLQAFVVFYGIKTFSSQLEVWWFVQTSVVPPEMLPHLFAMTLPLAIGWTGLAVWAWGPDEGSPATEERRRGFDLAWRVGLSGAVLYPVIFFLAGYFIAWQNPTLRAYYGGPDVPMPFLAHMARTFAGDPLVLPFEMGRGLLWVAIGWTVLRRTRGSWWVGGLLFASMLALVQNDMHLLPNPLMPREVRMWHLVETATSNFVFALGVAVLLAPRGGFAQLVESARSRSWKHRLDRRAAALSLPLELFLAVGGLVGGFLLYFDPTGDLVQLDPAMLVATPFSDYELPGLFLLLANGVLPTAAVVQLLTRSPRASWWVAASGGVLLGWMAAQVAWMGLVFWIQWLVVGLGIALLGVGSSWIVAGRHAGRRPA